MRRRLIVACATTGLVVGLGWPVSAFANSSSGQGQGGQGQGGQGNGHGNGGGKYGPHGPWFTESSSRTHPGGCLWVDGGSFSSNESIALMLYNQQVTLGSTRSDGNGSFSMKVCIPSSTKSGDYTIVPHGASGDSAATGITVEQ